MKLVDPATGKTYEVPDAEAEQARAKFGLTSPEELAAEQRSGGANLQTAGEEAIRTGAALVPGVDAGAAPAGLTELEPGQAENPLTGVYSPEARERREVNPVAAGFGNAAPAIIGGTLLPGAGVVGVAATLGLDAVSGYAQEAVDAELENRDIRGEDVLRNGALNAAFSLGTMGLGAAARGTLRGGQNLLERAAEASRASSRARAAAAEGEELAEAVSDSSVQDELLSTLAGRSEEVIDKTLRRLEQTRAPKVANNPNAQREAVETLADSFEKSDPAIVAELRELQKGPAGARLQGLRDVRAALGEESLLADEIDKLIAREDLWGADALGHTSSLEAALKLRPQPGATSDQLLEFSGAVRKVRDGEFAGLADQLEQYAERANEVRAASALGSVPQATERGVDYVKAMKSLDPTEAWRLTRDGADEGLRKLEANTVADAFQRVDDTLKEDVAMSVKREDFVKGAEKWSPAQVAKQDKWVGKASAEPVQDAPISLAGKTLDSLRALPLDQGDRASTLKGLRESAEFSATGRAPKAFDRLGHEQGITIVKSADGVGDGLYLRDGRHRFSVAKEKDLPSVWGTVVDDDGNVLFRGNIPLKGAAPTAGTGVLGKAESLLADMSRSKGSNPESGYALGGFAADAERAINQAITRLGNADPITRNFELDQLKRSLDSIVARLGAAKQGIDPAAKAFGTKRILELTNELRGGLESAEFFGRNSGLQSATNDAWKKLIDPYGRVKKRMTEFLGREFGNVGTDSGNVIRYNPDQVERAMAGFDRNFRTDLEKAIAGIDEMMAARQQSGLSHLDSLAASRADLQRVKEGFEFADLLRVAKAKAKEPAGVSVAKRALGSGSGAVTGAVAGGLPGAVIGAGLGVAAERGIAAGLERVALLKPGSRSALSGALKKHIGLARVEQARLLGDEAFAGTLPESLRRAALAAGAEGERPVQLAAVAAESAKRDRKLTARLMTDPEAARRALRLVGDVLPPLTRWQGEHETPQQALAAYRQLLDGFGRDPGSMLEQLQEEFGDIGSLSPKLQREVMVQAVRVTNYLQAHMPGKRNVSVVYPNGTPASSMEIRQFALRASAALDPASVHADARAGRLQKVQLDTLQQLWPREYDALRADVLDALGSGKASTSTRQRMSLLFGFGSGVDPALGPRTRAIVAAARAEQEAQAPAPSAAPGMGTTRPPPSAANQTPGGMAALQLGQSLTF